jgi:hypothetical protein
LGVLVYRCRICDKFVLGSGLVLGIVIKCVVVWWEKFE